MCLEALPAFIWGLLSHCAPAGPVDTAGEACAECSSRAPGPDARSARCCCWDSWSPCPLPAWPVPLAADWGTGRVRPFCCPPGVEDES